MARTRTGPAAGAYERGSWEASEDVLPDFGHADAAIRLPGCAMSARAVKRGMLLLRTAIRLGVVNVI